MQLRITVIEVGAGADDDEYQEEITKLQAHLTEGADKGNAALRRDIEQAPDEITPRPQGV